MLELVHASFRDHFLWNFVSDMQVFKATKAQPLYNASVDILTFTNSIESYNCYPTLYNGVTVAPSPVGIGACPEGNWVEHRDSNVLDSSARLGKHPRMKKTVPKLPKERSLTEADNHMRSRDFDDEDSDTSAPLEATPIDKRRRKVDRREIATTNFHGTKMLEEQDDDCEELDDFCNFRRFSSRKRKQTDFLGVEYGQLINGCDLNGRRRERGSRLLRRASRRLVFPLEPPVEEVGVAKISREESSSTSPASSLDLQMEKEVILSRKKKEDDENKSCPDSCADTADLNKESNVPISPSVAEVTDSDKSLTREAFELDKSLTKEAFELDKSLTKEAFELEFPIGSMVWGKLPGYNWWPGNVISYDASEGIKEEEEEEPSSNVRAWIKWYGETQLSKISADKLAHFHKFQDFFQPLQMKGTYKKAILASIKEAARRCKMEFLSSPDDKKLRWILSDQCPIPKLITEKEELDQEEADHLDEGTPVQEDKDLKTEPTSLDEVSSISDESVSHSSSVEKIFKQEFKAKAKARGGRGKKGRGKGFIRLTSLEQEMIEWSCGGFLPAGRDGLRPIVDQQVQVRVIPLGGGANEEKGLRTGGCGPDEDLSRRKQKVMLLHVRSKARFQSVNEGRAKMSDVCISCGDLDVATDHPLFQGGLCLNCKNDFMETSYLFDEDGSQMYCTICSAGEQVFMCDAENCSKVYCAPCVEKLCGSAELDRVRASAKWLCYMCSPDHSHVGLLEKRENWDTKLRELFMSDHEMEYDPPTFYPPLPPEERRSIRVLGLFDGIATGLVVLKELGLEVERYVASEVDMDAVYVSRVKHKEIIHVGDIEKITEKEVKAWGPFDLVIGGSPCNDLSVVNPARRGIYEGTGRLFFEFYRILSYTRPAPGEERPFFWLFENVVSMKPPDKQAISRFLQCNPVVVDARDMSAAHRARYFWGNLPGMNRPTTSLPSDRLTLQSCLEPNCFRVAQFTKLRTITTKMNSIKQTKKAVFPVRVEGQDENDQGDLLWCTEMERLFGFPDHYTDIANLGRSGRQRLLGKAWSVPVIRHLLSPLKDYFKSSTNMDVQSSSFSAARAKEDV